MYHKREFLTLKKERRISCFIQFPRFGSSRSHMSLRIGVPEDFAIFTEKHMSGLQAALVAAFVYFLFHKHEYNGIAKHLRSSFLQK